MQKLDTIIEFMDEFKEEYGLSPKVKRAPEEALLVYADTVRKDEFGNPLPMVERIFLLSDLVIDLKSVSGDSSNVQKTFIMLSIAELEPIT